MSVHRAAQMAATGVGGSAAPCSESIHSTIAGRSALDWLFSNLIATYKVPSSDFERLENSVQLTFKDPSWFSSKQGGYTNLCMPFISMFEWHPLSV